MFSAKTGARLLLISPMLWGCGQRSEPRVPLHVTRVVPDAAGSRLGNKQKPARLFLNSQISLFFSENLDPLSVTTDTVRVTRVGSGARVGFHQVRVGLRSVTLVPRPPVRANLEDGSLEPGALYRLEVPGFPLTNTVTARDGRGLQTGIVGYFRVVDRKPGDPDFATPFLPVGTGAEAFELRGRHDRLAQMAAGSGLLELHFSLPLLPTSVRPVAFKLTRLRGSSDPKRVEIKSAEVRSYPAPVHPYPGCAVELVFADPQDVQAGDWLYLTLPKENGLRDYRNRALQRPSEHSPVGVLVHKSPQVALLKLPLRNAGTGHVTPMRFQVTAPGHVGFVCGASGFRPLVHEQAGLGDRGVLEPKSDLVIDAGQGQWLDFRAIRIPEGVTVTLRSKLPVRIRSIGEISIAGSLVLDVAPPDGGVGALDSLKLEDLPTCTPVTLISGGNIHVTGQIQQRRKLTRKQACLAIVAGGTVFLPGAVSRVPVQTLISATQVEGTVQGPWLTTFALTPGSRRSVLAEAWTPWHQLPKDHPPVVRARAVGRAGLEVWVQFAPPHPLDPDQPYLDALSTMQRVSEKGDTTSVQRGTHVRFLLRGRVEPGQSLPRVRELLVETGG